MKLKLRATLRLITLAVFMYCIALSSFAQKNSKDYFLPKAKMNKTVFNMPDAAGKPSEFSQVMYYLKKGEQYEVIDKMYYRKKLIRTDIRLIDFTQTEIRLIKLQSATERETNKITVFSPPKIIMKLPGIGQTLEWSYKEANGRQTHFFAEWVKFKLNNVNTRAIRVTETIMLSNGLWFSGKLIYYYKEGIGLWKMEGETTHLQNTIYEFFALEYDSTCSPIDR
ncbi:MAG TPA: hypothetical protein PLJ60_03620 [Chryseolinea sp.]|nr:hypothetical protein [Chryseolinea sp.]HPM29403.1 hypothetical protein [Chryseolinea sp.]